MLKIYQSIRAYKLVTEVKVEGKPMTIEFTGGARHPKKRNGIYVTSSQKYQKAIEEAPGFNRSYKLVKEVEDSEQESKSALRVGTEDVPINHTDDIPELSEDLESNDYATADEKTDYSKITKAQDARNVLLDLDKELTYNDIKSKAQIHDQAKRLNISFPNLPK